MKAFPSLHVTASAADVKEASDAKAARLLELGATSVQLNGKLAISRVFCRVSEVVNMANRSTVVAYSHSKIMATLERGHSVNSALGFTLEAEGARLCSKCDGFSLDCDHFPGRAMVWNKMIADVGIEPHPESTDFFVDLRTQISALLGMFCIQVSAGISLPSL